jgi:polysaccharide export outer membrane protein
MIGHAICRCGAIAAAVFISGCATLPSAGPSVVEMRRLPAVDIVQVTPEGAASAARAATAAGDAAIAHTLAVLQSPITDPVFRLGRGDTVDVTLWSFSPWPGSSQPGGNPGAIALGSFTLPADGDVLLPFAGSTRLAGLTLAEAQAAISAHYARLRILESPSAAIRLAAAPRSDILVTGTVGQPKTLAWTPAGISLAQAVTSALGDGNAVLGQGDNASADAAIRVDVLRGSAPPAELPIGVALAHTIPLHPGDRVVVRKVRALEVTVLGGGARKPGIYGFGKQAMLANVLAQASGLDGNVADSHAVFVLRRRADGPPQLYDFAWNRVQGVIASNQFPMQDGDLVYVAEAPIVAVQKVIGILFQLTLPAQLLK